MGLFSTTQSNTQLDDTSSSMANQTSTVQDQVNLVGEGTVFEGTVRAENDVRASGQIIGTVEVEGKTMIAEGGVVEGEIITTNAEIAGQVQGEIHVEERLVLKSTAQVDGKIETDRLVVEEGAQFTGECEMGTPIAESPGSSSPEVSREEGWQNGSAQPDENETTNGESTEEFTEV
jgi:cytoskeletal protein CcmA (bactofilin family)